MREGSLELSRSSLHMRKKGSMQPMQPSTVTSNKRSKRYHPQVHNRGGQEGKDLCPVLATMSAVKSEDGSGGDDHRRHISHWRTTTTSPSYARIRMVSVRHCRARPGRSKNHM
jgi:hypothetical protein